MRRVGFAAHARPPDGKVVAEGPGTDGTEGVGFGQIFDRDDCFSHKLVVGSL